MQPTTTTRPAGSRDAIRTTQRSTQYALSLVLDFCRTTELTEFAVVVVEKKLGLLHKAGVPGLLFCPIQHNDFYQYMV
jgi:hypothetical protein